MGKTELRKSSIYCHTVFNITHISHPCEHCCILCLKKPRKQTVFNINTRFTNTTTYVEFHTSTIITRTAVAQWLMCCATNRKFAGSIPAGVSGFFIFHLGSTQPLTEVFPGGKGGRCVRLTTYHHPVPLSRNLATLNSWNPLGLSRPVMGLLYLTTIIPQGNLTSDREIKQHIWQ